MSSRAWSNVPIGITVVTGLLLSAGPAGAQAQTETLKVQARIGELCTVSSASLDFGQAINLSLETATDADGAINIDCGGAEATFNVALDGGLTPGGGPNRNMLQGGTGSPILYWLFKDAQRASLWNAGESVSATINGSGSVPVYGRIAPQGNGHPAGLYTDEVMITLSF
jgi:spore coat protein U-like protein